jgi:hypothetical protein
LESAATDEGEARGVHVKRNGEGAGEVLTMSMSERGSLGAEESVAADEREITGLKYSNNLKRDRKSMSDRGLESAATDEGEARGVHVKRNGVGAGEVLTMSMSERGSLNLGSQRTSDPLMLLHLVSSTVDPDAPPVSKISRNQADIADVLLANQFFKSINSNSRNRIKEWKVAAGKSNDNSHIFTTKKTRNNSARRATDVWKISRHESVVSVLAIAPNATEVNDADRAVSASYREGEAQRSKENRKRKKP